MFPFLKELSRQDRRGGKHDEGDFYVNFITVGPITEDAQRITGMIN